MPNNSTIPHADLEPDSGNESERAYEIKKINSPTRVHVHSRRHRETDSDGICAKWVIDAIVAAGILRDDSPTYVSQVTFSQEKVDKSEPEMTIITLNW